MDAAKRAREWQSWKNWWDSTYSTADYLEYVAEKPTDFLGVVMSTYNQSYDKTDAGQADQSDDLSESEQMQSTVNTAALLKKTAYVPGMWNALSVLEDGLGGIEQRELDNLTPADDDARDYTSETAGGALTTGHTIAGLRHRTADLDKFEEHDVVVDGLHARLQTCWKSLKTSQSAVMQLSIKYNRIPYSFAGSVIEGVTGGRRRSLPRLARDTQSRRQSMSTAKLGGSMPRLSGIMRGDNGPGSVTLTATGCVRALGRAVSLWEAATMAIVERETALEEWKDFLRTVSDPARFFSEVMRISRVAHQCSPILQYIGDLRSARPHTSSKLTCASATCFPPSLRGHTHTCTMKHPDINQPITEGECIGIVKRGAGTSRPRKEACDPHRRVRFGIEGARNRAWRHRDIQRGCV